MLLSRLRSSLTNREGRALTEEDWLLKALGATRRDGLPSISPRQSLQVVAAYACVRVISETMAAVPLLTYRVVEGGKGKKEDKGYHLHPIFSSLSNPEMTAIEFREAMTGHALLRGRAFAEIERDRSNKVLALWPLDVNFIQEFRDPDTDELKYLYTLPSGEQRSLRWEDVFILKGFMGLSAIQLFQSTFSTALTSEEYGERFFSNNSKPGGVLEAPRILSRTARERLKASWEAAHRGLTNAHRVAVLENGVTWKSVGISPRDAQFLELRQFQTNEIARIFRVPPHKIGELTRATFSNIEHQSIEFTTDTIFPWSVRWEQSIQRDVYLKQRGSSQHVTVHTLDVLLRGDTLTRSQANDIQRKAGALSINEWRDMEGRNPVEGGDEYLPEKPVPAPSPAPPSPPSGEEETPTRTYRGLRIVGRSA